MAKVIRQSVVLPAPARELYSMYLNAKAHAAITGHQVQIGARPVARFRAFDGALRGRILQTIPGRLIVQHGAQAHFTRTTRTPRWSCGLPLGEARGALTWCT